LYGREKSGGVAYFQEELRKTTKISVRIFYFRAKKGIGEL
jgi:hypothetical protein